MPAWPGPLFAKIGSEIFTDSRLRSSHFRIYCILAASVKFGYRDCSLGQPLLSKLSGLSKSTVFRVLQDLKAWGHLSFNAEKGIRTSYILTSHAFQPRPSSRKPQKRLSEPQKAAFQTSSRSALDEILNAPSKRKKTLLN